MAGLSTMATIFASDTSIVDSSEVTALGTRAVDADGNEYIYLKGVADVAANDWVSYDESHQVARLAANAVGRVAVAKAAVVADKYGWFQIFGTTSAATDAVATDKAVYIDATVGRVDDAAVTGDLVVGAWTRSTDSSTNVATVELSYPVVTDVLG